MSPNLEPQGSSYLESEREVGGGAGVGVGMRDKWLGKVRLINQLTLPMIFKIQ